MALGLILTDLRHLPEAVERFAMVARENPESPLPEAALGLLAWRAQDANAAKMHFGRAVDLKSTDATVYFNYAVLLNRSRNDDAKLLAVLQQAVQLKPEIRLAHSFLADRYVGGRRLCACAGGVEYSGEGKPEETPWLTTTPRVRADEVEKTSATPGRRGKRRSRPRRLRKSGMRVKAFYAFWTLFGIGLREAPACFGSARNPKIATAARKDTSKTAMECTSEELSADGMAPMIFTVNMATMVGTNPMRNRLMAKSHVDGEEGAVYRSRMSRSTDGAFLDDEYAGGYDGGYPVPAYDFPQTGQYRKKITTPATRR